MRPAKRLKVRGRRSCGLTSMRTRCCVWMKTWRRPALFSGESRSVSSSWCVMSGRTSAASRPSFRRMDKWSSQFSNSYPCTNRAVRAHERRSARVQPPRLLQTFSPLRQTLSGRFAGPPFGGAGRATHLLGFHGLEARLLEHHDEALRGRHLLQRLGQLRPLVLLGHRRHRGTACGAPGERGTEVRDSRGPLRGPVTSSVRAKRRAHSRARPRRLAPPPAARGRPASVHVTRLVSARAQAHGSGRAARQGARRGEARDRHAVVRRRRRRRPGAAQGRRRTRQSAAPAGLVAHSPIRRTRSAPALGRAAPRAGAH